ncbi:MAG TPA: hypothetical protein VG870_13665 [Chitinophagaceae bacterium]|nr:hypothetical protein [Chitinophagaceae bacterium]
MKKIFLSAITLAALFSSCKKDHDNSGLFNGPVVSYQGGKAWTWVQTDADNKPLRVGISIDDQAMAHLDPGTSESGEDADAISLAFDSHASLTPFQHALVEWNPHGHEPAGIYDKPHFDFHFYMTSEADRLAIPAYEQNSAAFDHFPPAGYMPDVYQAIPGGVPQMGTHWVDVNTPELHGQPFTQTFLYGSYNGAVTFYEPMITKAFLYTSANFRRDIPVPAKFARAGYYPTRMQVQKTGGATQVILEGFVYRQAS